MLQPCNPYIFHFDITYTYTIIGLTTHINFDLPIHAQDVQWPHKKIRDFSIYEKTVNHKNSQKVPFGR